MAWAEEDPRELARRRRQPLLLIGLVDLLVVGIGTTAAVDLRRLDTPGGLALAWTQAAVFGDCDDYLGYSLPDAALLEQRSPEELCRDLRAATADARADSIRIGLELEQVRATVGRAAVQITLTREDKPVLVDLTLVRRDGAWRVVRDARVCAAVRCA